MAMPRSSPWSVTGARVKAPPLAEFVRHYLIVEKETGELIPFDLWPAQEEALEVIAKSDKLVVPKGRQVGITWLELAAMLWAGTFWGHRLFPIARQSDEYAREAITRLLILAGYDANSDANDLRVLAESPLPQQWRPKIVGKTRRELRLANGSSYRALTATQPIARGLAAYWGLADEYAFWPWPARQLQAMESGCSRLHVVSTGNGADDAFASLYENATGRPRRLQDALHPLRCRPTPKRGVVSAERRGGGRPGERPARACPHTRRTPSAHPRALSSSAFAARRHVQEVEIVANWQTWRAIDFGYRHAACLWAQRSPAGQLFIVDELLPENATTPEFVEQDQGTRGRLRTGSSR